MDIEGLGKLIETNHEENLRRFDGLTKLFDEQKLLCNERMDNIEGRCDGLCQTCKVNTKTLTQIKTIGSLAILVWGAIVGFMGNIFK